MSDSKICIQDYSAKSFVVRGETRDYKDSLKSLGGKWNASLTDKETGEKFGAWIFWSDKRQEIEEWIKTCKEDNLPSIGKGGSSVSSSGKSYNSPVKTSQTLEVKIDKLLKMMEAICRFHNIPTEELS
jgi:hypothetical protein